MSVGRWSDLLSLHLISSVTKLRRRKLFYESPNFLWFIWRIEKCWRKAYVALRLCRKSQNHSKGWSPLLIGVLALRSVSLPLAAARLARALSHWYIILIALSLWCYFSLSYLLELSLGVDKRGWPFQPTRGIRRNYNRQRTTAQHRSPTNLLLLYC